MTATVSHLAANLSGSEASFRFPDYVVRESEDLWLYRGGETHRPQDEARHRLAHGVQLGSGFSLPIRIRAGETIAAAGPDYWDAAVETGLRSILDQVEWETTQGKFRIAIGTPQVLRSMRTEVTRVARRQIGACLRKVYARSWPPACDKLLTLQMADPSDSLEDQLLTRALKLRLTDALAFDRVSRFDAQRLGVGHAEFVETLDRWVSGLGTPVHDPPEEDQDPVKRLQPSDLDMLNETITTKVAEVVTEAIAAEKKRQYVNTEFDEIIAATTWNEAKEDVQQGNADSRLPEIMARDPEEVNDNR